MNAASSNARYSALILAGQRGPEDPLASLSPEGHKCLLPIGGRPMIERVAAALMASREIGAIAISIDRPAVLEKMAGFAQLVERGRVRVVESAKTPATSVLDAIDELGEPYPLLVTTADHPLLSPGMLKTFIAASEAHDAAITAGLVHESVVKAALPEAKRTYLRFRDGGYSGANLFLLRESRALSAVSFWRQVESDRKRPWRIAKAFGPGLLLAYLLRVLTLDEAMKRISERLAAPARAVVLELAEAAVDVDKPGDIPVVEAFLNRRGGGPA
ncbi:MAG: NTP transferase domain-containing protein [Kiloniellales bacterium]|nr:NTP transferase domain-containing protein [Kiloniellales bacterium]